MVSLSLNRGGGSNLALIVSKDAYVDDVADTVGALLPTWHPGKRDLELSQRHSVSMLSVLL